MEKYSDYKKLKKDTSEERNEDEEDLREFLTE